MRRRPCPRLRAGLPSWTARGGRSRSGSAVSRGGRPSRTPAGCVTRSACRCPPVCRRRSPSRCRIRSATWWPGTRGAMGRSRRLRRRPGGTAWARLGGERHALQRLAAERRIVEGEFLPGGRGTEWCDAEVLRLLRRRCLAKLRKEVEPAPCRRRWPAFLPAWQNAGQPAGQHAPGQRPEPGGPAAAGARPARMPSTTWWTSSPARRCPPQRGRRWCCRAGFPVTSPRCSTS